MCSKLCFRKLAKCTVLGKQIQWYLKVCHCCNSGIVALDRNVGGKVVIITNAACSS